MSNFLHRLVQNYSFYSRNMKFVNKNHDGVSALREIFVDWPKRATVTDLGVQFVRSRRDSPDLLGKLRTRSFQGLAYDSRGSVVANSADVGNG